MRGLGRVLRLWAVRARASSTLQSRLDQHAPVSARDELATQRFVQGPCPHCARPVTHPAHLWCCPGCGAARCPSCSGATQASSEAESKARRVTAVTACPACGTRWGPTASPTAQKTATGAAMVGFALDAVPPLLYLRLAAHAPAAEAVEWFRAANRAPAPQAVQQYTATMRALNWVRLHVPEYWHSAGYDADYARAHVCRLHAEGRVADAVTAATDVFPELFCNQSVVPIEEDPKAFRARTRRAASGKLSSTFVNWSEIEQSVPEAQRWVKPEKTVLDVSSDDAFLFKKCGGVKKGRERWRKESQGRMLADFRYVFDSEWGAAYYLSHRYEQLSDGFPQAAPQQTLTVGTDCVLFGGTRVAPGKGGLAAAVYVFREQNVVVKLAMSQRVDSASVQQQQAMATHWRALVLDAHSHAAVVQMRLQDHAVAAVQGPSWWSRLFG